MRPPIRELTDDELRSVLYDQVLELAAAKDIVDTFTRVAEIR
jgi:hypothetical protein